MELPLPLWQQLLFLAFGPVILALIMRQLMRGWAHAVQGEELSEETKNRQRFEFWSVLIVLYVVFFTLFVIAHLFEH